MSKACCRQIYARCKFMQASLYRGISATSGRMTPHVQRFLFFFFSFTKTHKKIVKKIRIHTE